MTLILKFLMKHHQVPTQYSYDFVDCWRLGAEVAVIENRNDADDGVLINVFVMVK